MIEIVLRLDTNKRFKFLPKRYIFERIFLWFESYKIMGKDYEFSPETTQIMVCLTTIQIVLNRVKK